MMASVMVLSGCVTALAKSLPHYRVDADGNTVLETFLLSSATLEAQEFWGDWFASSRNLLFMTADGGYSMMVVPDGAEVTLLTTGHPGLFEVACSKSYKVLRFGPRDAAGNYNYDTLATVTIGANLRYAMLVTGTYYRTETLPNLGYDYVAVYDGNLIIYNDLGTAPPEGGGDDEGGGILDWLTGFWDTLKNMIIGLFVPEDGYITGWFDEIKTAFAAKVGGLGDLIGQIGDIFGELKDVSAQPSSVILETHDNQWYPGYQGVRVDLLEVAKPLMSWLRSILNGVLSITTVIMCYRKLTAMVKGGTA